MGSTELAPSYLPGFWLRLFDLSIILIGMLLAKVLFPSPGISDELLVIWSLVAGLLTLYCFEVFSLYRVWRRGEFSQTLMTTVAIWSGVVFFLLFLLYFLKLGDELRRAVFVAWVASVAVALVLWRWLYHTYLTLQRISGRQQATALIIGLTPVARRLAQEIAQEPGLGVRILGFCDDRDPMRIHGAEPGELLGDVDMAIEMASRGGVDKLFIALPMRAESRIADIIERCSNTVSEIHLVPNFFIYNLFNAAWYNVGSLKTLSIYESPIRGPWGVLKRAEDIAIATFALVVFALPMLVIAIAIRVESPGPILFRQYRYGLDGKAIEVWKFRSMTILENGTTIKQATRHDDRVTRLGRLLRRTSLDELPQFFNVMQGQMSVVGPRPHAVAHNEHYRALIQGYMLRHKVKPGITGWAQVNGWRGETDTLDKMAKRVEFDLHYITHWSVMLDIRIVAMTLTKGFFHENAY